MNKAISLINNLMSKHGLLITFVLFMFLEAFAKYYVTIREVTPIPLIAKTIYFGIIGILLFLQKNTKKELVFIALLFLIYCVAQLTLVNSFSINSMSIAGKFVAPLILFMFFNTLKTPSYFADKVFKVFEWIMLVNSGLILIGAITSAHFLKAYFSNRFGYNGMFHTASIASYAYIFTLFYYVITYKKKVFHQWKFVLIYISCFCIGTKAIYIVIIGLTFYTIYIQQFRMKKLLLLLLVGISIIGSYLFFFKFGIFDRIRESHGWLSSLLSFRDRLFVENTMPYIEENWSLLNYLFGGVSDFNLRSQMELFDVFFFWGIIGGITYYYIFFKTVIQFNLDKTLWFLIFLFLIIITFSGNFFVYATNIVFLLVLREKLVQINEQLKSRDEPILKN